MENVRSSPFQMQTPSINRSPFTTQGPGHNVDISMGSPYGLSQTPQGQTSSSTTQRMGLGNGQTFPNQFGKK